MQMVNIVIVCCYLTYFYHLYEKLDEVGPAWQHNLTSSPMSLYLDCGSSIIIGGTENIQTFYIEDLT